MSARKKTRNIRGSGFPPPGSTLKHMLWNKLLYFLVCCVNALPSSWATFFWALPSFSRSTEFCTSRESLTCFRFPNFFLLPIAVCISIIFAASLAACSRVFSLCLFYDAANILFYLLSYSLQFMLFYFCFRRFLYVIWYTLRTSKKALKNMLM